MKMKIPKRKFYNIAIIAVLLIIEVVITGVLNTSKGIVGIDESLRALSLLCVIAYILCIYSWHKQTKELLCPYIVFFSSMFFFCCGQCFGWAFHFDMGSKDMWARVDNGINREILFAGVKYSIIGFTTFHLGALIAEGKETFSQRQIWKEEQVLNAYRSLGKVLIIICVPAFIAITIQDVYAVYTNGYLGYYAVRQQSSAIMRILNMVAEYYQPCLLLLLIAFKDKKLYRRIIVSMMMLDIVLALYIGGRSGAVMSFLGIILAYHYFVKEIKPKKALLGIIGAYFGVALLNTVAGIRELSDRTISGLISLFFESLGNAVGVFIGELGWNITSICWTMMLVPSSYPFRYGLSYLVSLIAWIPSAFFGGNHPVVKYGALADWLQNALNKGYGPGYTNIAEAYINFGNLGFIALFVEGILISLVISRIRRKDVKIDLLGATFQIVVIMTVMKPLVRSSLSVAMREVVLVLLPLYLLVYFRLRRHRRTN